VTRTPQPAELDRIATRTARLANLLRSDTVTDALRHARTHAEARGYPAATIGDGGSRSTEPTSSTERAALTHDPTLDHFERMVDALTTVDQATAELVSLLAQWAASAREQPERGPLAVYCANMANGCENILVPGDIRRGRCPRCAKHLARHGRDWNQRVHAELDDPVVG
jgi:hypothetical protein